MNIAKVLEILGKKIIELEETLQFKEYEIERLRSELKGEKNEKRY